MIHYSSTTAVDLSFTGNLSQGGLNRDSQHQRYAALDVLLAFE
jgi:hypothetical protein